MKNSSFIIHSSSLYKEFIDKTGNNRSSKVEERDEKKRAKIRAFEIILILWR
jgi:hypothetical protein